MQDARLVQHFLKGDVQAFNALAGKWQQRIHRFAFRYFGNSDEAAEITQKTLIKAYQKLDTLDDARKFGPWLYRIANNLCLDELKRAGRKRAVDLEVLNEAVDEKKQADQQISQKEVSNLIAKALVQLPTEQRVVVIFKEFEQMTFNEIAEILDEPENTIKSRMYYGLKKLKGIFDQWNLTKEELYYDE